MKPPLLPLLLLGLLALPLPATLGAPEAPAQEEQAAPGKDDANANADDEAAAQKAIAQFLGRLKPRTGKIPLGDGLAVADLPEGLCYLDEKDSRAVIVDFWGNPPEVAEGVLGMILKSPESLLKPEHWGIVISYSEDGHVDDSDAAKIDYSKLLKKMKEGTAESNKERLKNGYAKIELVGWAEAPHYDASTHKIYWAKELAFNDNPEHTLNYCIRVLGRKGVLELNTVADLSALKEVRSRSAEILGKVDFVEGNRYADFNSSTDKMAEYGITALVAGGVAAKMGLFKMLLGVLIAAKKLVIVGVLAVGGFISKLFKRKQ